MIEKKTQLKIRLRYTSVLTKLIGSISVFWADKRLEYKSFSAGVSVRKSYEANVAVYRAQM